MKTHKFAVKALIALGGLGTSSLSFAWGAEGHRLIAEMAETRLTPATKANIARLLSLEPGATLASLSTWADAKRSRTTAAWHYVNMPTAAHCHYVAERDCAGGACVVAALDEQTRILGSNVTDVEKLVALKYVVHLMGDIHQPMHAGGHEDKGGNKYQVQAFGRGSNLHKLWDSGMLDQWPGGTVAIKAEWSSLKPHASLNPNVQAIAEESCKAVEMEKLYPPDHLVGEDYFRDHKGLLKQQLFLASERLAMVLNAAFGQ